MELIDVEGNAAVVKLRPEELLALSNALNEVCNGVDIGEFEFRARLGVERSEARALLQEVGAVFERIESTS